MAYDNVESSVDNGSPITLFEFLYGATSGDAFRYVNSIGGAGDTIVAAGMQWQPFQIRHGDITNSGTLDRAPLDIEMSFRAGIAEMYKVSPPSQPVRLRIWRGHPSDGDYKLIWSGRVLDGEWEGPTVSFTAEPLATSLRRVGLRRFYQYGCSHVLYGPDCKVSRSSNTGHGIVVNVPNQKAVDIEIRRTPIALVAEHLIGGVFRVQLPNGQVAVRTVTGATGIGSDRYRLQLMSILPQVSVGMQGEVTRGCTHNFQTCRDRFRNTPNYGGCPNIPTKNPFVNNSF